MRVRRLTRLILACMGDVTRDRRRVAQAWRAVRRAGSTVHSTRLWYWQKRLARTVDTLAACWALCVK